MRLAWLQPEDLIAHELVQCRDEGIDVEDIGARWTASGGDRTPGRLGFGGPLQLRPLAQTLLAELADRIAARGPSADEPDDLAAIEAQWSRQPVLPAADDVAVGDRVHGGWLGRAAGCLLGKPVEKMPRDGIRAIAESAGNWPIRAYFSAAGCSDDVAARWLWNRRSASTSLAENIDGMPEDDDLNYTMLALDLMERLGAWLSTSDVAIAWLDSLPAGRLFTAERVVYRNLLDGVDELDAARMCNPFREWIGALIRTDAYGWAFAGDPRAAARLAHVDARLSHTRNGIYGAMFVAAMAAAAVVADDVGDVLEAGLAVVPPRSRLVRAVRRGMAIAESGTGLDAALDQLDAEFGEMHWVHVLNNAAVIGYALSLPGGDFAAAIGTAVAAGWDTDSTAATVGGVIGALRGATALPAAWTAPLHNRIATSLPGFDGSALDDLARRTVTVGRRLRAGR